MWIVLYYCFTTALLVLYYRYVDTNGDGHLNYFEFCAAFQVASGRIH